MAFNIYKTITAFTRKAYDQEFNNMLDEDNTLFMNLALGRPATVKGNELAIRNIIDGRQGFSSRSGYDTYNFTVKNVWGYGNIYWVEYKNGIGIDGHEYKIQTGQELEDALDDGAGMLSSGGVRTLIALHKEDVMAQTVDCYRQISAEMYGDGTGSNGNAIVGLNAIMDPTMDYAGIAPLAYGYHDWEAAIDDLDSPTQNGHPAKWAPLYKDCANQPMSVYTDLQRLLIALNFGGSKKSRAMPNAMKRSYDIYMSQRNYADIEHILRDKLRRPDTGDGASAEIGGFQDRLHWDAYRATLYPDTDCPNDEIYIFNVNCLKYCQQDTDTKYMKRWRLSPNQDVVGIPYKKMHQLRCDNRSQTGRLSNFSSITY